MRVRVLQGRAPQSGWLIAVVATVLCSTTTVATGREPVDDRYCTTCHGSDGKGNESVQAPRLAGMEAWYLRRQLENFRAGIRGAHPMDGPGRAMRAMATNLSDASISDIIVWVGTWPYTPAEITLQGNAAAGRALYTSCATCHGDAAQGNRATGAPALRGQNDWYLQAQLDNFRAGHRGSHAQDRYGQQMAAMVGVLPDDEAVRNVIAYINSLASRQPP